MIATIFGVAGLVTLFLLMVMAGGSR